MKNDEIPLSYLMQRLCAAHHDENFPQIKFQESRLVVLERLQTIARIRTQEYTFLTTHFSPEKTEDSLFNELTLTHFLEDQEFSIKESHQFLPIEVFNSPKAFLIYPKKNKKAIEKTFNLCFSNIQLWLWHELRESLYQTFGISELMKIEEEKELRDSFCREIANFLMPWKYEVEPGQLVTHISSYSPLPELALEVQLNGHLSKFFFPKFHIHFPTIIRQNFEIKKRSNQVKDRVIFEYNFLFQQWQQLKSTPEAAYFTIKEGLNNISKELNVIKGKVNTLNPQNQRNLNTKPLSRFCFYENPEQTWHIAFDHNVCSTRYSYHRGLRFIQYLLARPGEEFSADFLLKTVKKSFYVNVDKVANQLKLEIQQYGIPKQFIDQANRKDYEKLKRKLIKFLIRAKNHPYTSDFLGVVRKIEHALDSSFPDEDEIFGLKTVEDSYSKMIENIASDTLSRDNVRNQINNAIKDIEKASTDLAAYLKSTIRRNVEQKNRLFCYIPERVGYPNPDEIRWDTYLSTMPE